MIKEIKFTDKALKQINTLLSKKDKGSFFRIAIKGGGCSGFQYEFTFDQSMDKDDLSFENILIDKASAVFNRQPLIAILKKVPFSFFDNRLLICFSALSVNLISFIIIDHWYY